jgi:hypothetical protein
MSMPMDHVPDAATATTRHRLRLAFFSFLLTFVASRVVVFLIMARRLPDLFVHVGGTHVHHLNYGIFLLAAVGAYTVFARPSGRGLTRASVLYAIGLALTFDEFGMWLHLGGGYWQRASFDAVLVLAALLGLAAFAPPLRAWRGKQFTTAVAAVLLAAVFYFLLLGTFRFGARIELRLTPMETTAPT